MRLPETDGDDIDGGALRDAHDRGRRQGSARDTAIQQRGHTRGLNQEQRKHREISIDHRFQSSTPTNAILFFFYFLLQPSTKSSQSHRTLPERKRPTHQGRGKPVEPIDARVRAQVPQIHGAAGIGDNNLVEVRVGVHQGGHALGSGQVDEARLGACIRPSVHR